MRGATDSKQWDVNVGFAFQSTLPVRGATSKRTAWFEFSVSISIHAPREGSDAWLVEWLIARYEFQSTLPVRGATQAVYDITY